VEPQNDTASHLLFSMFLCLLCFPSANQRCRIQDNVTKTPHHIRKVHSKTQDYTQL